MKTVAATAVAADFGAVGAGTMSVATAVARNTGAALTGMIATVSLPDFQIPQPPPVAPDAWVPPPVIVIEPLSGGSPDLIVNATPSRSNPVLEPVIEVGAGFAILQVSGAALDDAFVASFYYPSTVTGQDEESLALLFFDGTDWRPVLGSGGVAPEKSTTDNLNGIESGGRFAVVFSRSSIPLVTALDDTVFAMAIPFDVEDPEVQITAPTTAALYRTTLGVVSLAGTASDNLGVTQITWSNDRGGSGVAEGTAEWSISILWLEAGRNVITVTAWDAAARSGTATLIFDFHDQTAPVLIIDSVIPGQRSVSENPITLSGTASDDVGVTGIVWSNDRGGSGKAEGVGNWRIVNVPLQPGLNTVAVTARDAAGNSFQENYRVTYTPDDIRPPQLEITTPTAQEAITVNGSFITLSGTATDDVQIASVSWASDRGASGLATGTEDWTVTNLPLQPGENSITLSVRDWVGKVASRVLRVTYQPPVERAGGDFNGDGRSDILVQNRAGSVAFWLMDGPKIKDASTPYQIPEGWRIAGSGDFNRDGHADVVLEHRDGSIAFWLMREQVIQAGLVTLSLPQGWHIAATGDFDADQQTDLVLQHDNGRVAFWLLEGVRLRAGLAPYQTDAAWHIRAAGRFNGDAQTDLVLQNDSGAIAFWLMNGTNIVEARIPYSVPSGWTLAAAGSFRGQPQTYLVFQHQDGSVAFWKMAGTTILEGTIPYVIPVEWRIAFPR